MTQSLTQTPETASEKGIKRFGFFLLRITVILSVPFAGLLGFSVAYVQQAISIILLAYIITADLLKIVFFRVNEKRRRL